MDKPLDTKAKIDAVAEKAINGGGGPAPGIYKGPPSDPWRYIITEGGDVYAFEDGSGDVKTPNSAQREAILAQVTDGTLTKASPEAPPPEKMDDPMAVVDTPDTQPPEPGGIDSKEARRLMDAAPTDPEKVSLKDPPPPVMEDGGVDSQEARRLMDAAGFYGGEKVSLKGDEGDMSVPDQHRKKYGMVLPTPTTMGMLGDKISDIAGRAWDKFNSSSGSEPAEDEPEDPEKRRKDGEEEDEEY